MQDNTKLYFRGTSTQKVFPVTRNNRAADIDVIGTTKKRTESIGQREIVYGVDGSIGALTATDYKQPKRVIQITNIDQHKRKRNNPQTGRVYDTRGISPSLTTMQGGGQEPKIRIREATKKGYDIAKKGDSINLSIPGSKTRRGRVGEGIANTLDTSCEQGTLTDDFKIRKLTPRECFRLQGFPDELFDKAAEVNSDSQLYKQAGNSVTVNVIYEIARNIK